jgi:hypothetical protein
MMTTLAPSTTNINRPLNLESRPVSLPTLVSYPPIDTGEDNGFRSQRSGSSIEESRFEAVELDLIARLVRIAYQRKPAERRV